MLDESAWADDLRPMRTTTPMTPSPSPIPLPEDLILSQRP